MTAEQFRKLVLAQACATEGAHGGHPDFRLHRRVFATLDYPKPGWAMVKLSAEQQEMVTAAEPAVFSPAKGSWGRRGATLLLLAKADMRIAKSAIRMAWANAQP